MTERHFNEMMATHTELLANIAEGIRRELEKTAKIGTHTFAN